MKKIGQVLLFLIVLIFTVYFIGPKTKKPELNNILPVIPANIENVETFVLTNERQYNLKPDNQARIVWANDSAKTQTEFCLLYLHGFSGSWYEGFPVNLKFSERYGCNAFFTRLSAHGLETDEPLIDYSPDSSWETAKEALMVARILGRKVIIMSTSTGGTLSLKLAAEFPEYVHSLIMFSPNARINNPAAFLLSGPWGLQIARKITKGNYRITSTVINSKECQYWYCKYRLEGIVALQQLIDATMHKETFRKVSVPVFVGYYYKDENNQDPTARVSAMLKMFKELGTPDNNKVKQAFPDAGAHVIACDLISKSAGKVAASTFSFAENTLGLLPVRQ